MEFDMPTSQRLFSLIVVATIIGVVLGTCAGCVRSTLNPPMFVTNAQQRDLAVAIWTSKSPDHPSGSGVIVSSHVVLTAWHVVNSGDEILVETRAGRRVRAVVDRVDARGDVARLLVVNTEFDHVPRRVPIARTYGDEVLCLRPGTPWRAEACGKVTKAGSGPNGIEHEALTIHGNSGSGIYDRRGRLVGIVTMTFGEDSKGGAATAVSPRRWLVDGAL